MEVIKGYQLLEKLYQSPKYRLYRAIHLEDNKHVIIKCPREEHPSLNVLADLRHEYSLLKQLAIPGVIQALDLIESGHQTLLVLEDIQGKTLEQFLNGKALTDLNCYFSIALQLVSALEKLHEEHIIHKDIKPSNIIIEPHTLLVKLIDFSISSQLIEELQTYENLTELEGSLAYLSPEQTGRMNRKIDYRTDFYSLGITFYEMLAGQLPFQATDSLELVHCHLARVPALLTTLKKDIPNALSHLIAKLLAKLPEERYLSAKGLKADLEICAQQWKNQAGIEDFILGAQDKNEQLYYPQKLYGREVETQTLLSAFERVYQGNNECVFISGYSGIGKTSLIKELYQPLTYRKGYFIQGKFDQLQQTKPYSALIQAFQQLIRQVLAEPEESLAVLRLAIANAVGDLQPILAAFIPGIERLLPPQTSSVQSTIDASSQLAFAFYNFAKVFRTSETPLVIFLDDLQWADSASLLLLKKLLANGDSRYLLLIGAYRDNEVDFSHPLMEFKQFLKKEHFATTDIALAPLTDAHLHILLADMLSCGLSEVSPLAKVVLQKTQGNPFFTVEFLRSLYQQQLLRFDYQKGQWQWDIAQILEQKITANIVDLLISKIQQMPTAVQEKIQLAACIGNQFDLATLSLISQESDFEVMKLLQEALHADLIGIISGNYKLVELLEKTSENSLLETVRFQFKHDRIQQAAYQLIPDERKPELHLIIGRALRAALPAVSHDENFLLQVVEQLNQSGLLMIEPAEQLQLAELNLQAGNHVKKVAAYHAAASFFKKGIALLPKSRWVQQYDLSFMLCLGLIESQLAIGNYVEAEQLISQLFMHAQHNLHKLQIYVLEIRRFALLNRYEDALKQGLSALKIGNLHLPLHPKPYHLLSVYVAIKWLQRGKSFTDTEINQANNAEERLLQFIIYDLMATAYVTYNNELLALLAFCGVRRSLQYGYTAESANSYFGYSFVELHVLRRYKAAFITLEHIQHISKQYAATESTAKTLFSIGHMISLWKYPLSQSLDYNLQAYQLAQRFGYIETMGYSLISYTDTLYALGKPLSEVRISIDKALQQHEPQDYYYSVWKLHAFSMEVLQQESAPISHQSTLISLLKSAGENRTAYEKACYYFAFIKLAYLLDEFLLVSQAGDAVKPWLDAAIGTMVNAEGKFFLALSLSALYQKASRQEQRRYFKQIKSIHKIFKRWASWCAVNFKPYYLLLSAELASIQGHYRLACDLYDEAAQMVVEPYYPNLIGVINECAARFYLSNNKPHLARHYLREAHYGYKRWGALGLCQKLNQQFPWALQELESQANRDSSTQSPTSTLAGTPRGEKSLDFMAILKLTQTIASEIQLDKLLKKLLQIVLEHAGAQRSILFIKKDSAWFIEAEGTLEQQTIWLVDAEAIESRQDLPLSVIQYVQRTEESVLIADVKSQTEFKDPYLQQALPKSLLIIPFHYQGQLRRILYLENNVSTQAFTPQHQQSITLLVSQAAVSLENAYLYYQATHDPLTGLANRSLLNQIFKHSSVRVTHDAKQLAIIFFDLDYFKTINDTLGHDVGDKLLIYFSQQIKACIRGGDLAVRLGGDEFVVLLDYIDDTQQVKNLLDNFYQQLKTPAVIQDHIIHISSSIGVSIYPQDGLDIQSLLKQADTALYRSKELGKNQYQFYSISLMQKFTQIQELEAELKEALHKGEFCLYYQPIYSLESNAVTSIEALLRWQHPEKGLLEANQFIDLLEKSHLMLSVGEWVLRTACHQLKTWQLQGLSIIPIAVNLSVLQIKKQSISQLVATILKETQLAPEYLELEFTESMLIENTANIIREIEALTALGIKLVIDDFGTGYSSLAYLTRIPVSKIKIDRSFINDNQSQTPGKIIVEAIIALAHHLKLEVIAEGVETKNQLEMLREQHADSIQGFYLSRPLAKEDCEQLLKSVDKI